MNKLVVIWFLALMLDLIGQIIQIFPKGTKKN